MSICYVFQTFSVFDPDIKTDYGDCILKGLYILPYSLHLD